MSAQRTELVRHRLLLVEASRRSIDALRDAFTELGYECEVALDLKTARNILGERQMDLAVINAKVPDERDEKLVQELKADAPAMRLIIYNGTSNKTRQRKLRRIGADSYLSAASDLRAVIRSVQRVLEG